MTIREIVEKRRRLWERTHSSEQDRRFVAVAAAEIVGREELRREVRGRPWLLIEACFTVVTKQNETVPFFLNAVQRAFIGELEMRGTSKPYLILKGRQEGFTTLITAIALSFAITQQNFFGFTIADCGDNTRSIFNDKARALYDRLPSILKPTEKFNSAKELFFSVLNSSWRIATASKDVARSKTLSFVHYSEAAFYKCALSELQASVGSACVPGALIIYETTANGFNEMYELWESESCVNLFYPWWLAAEYRSTEYEYIDKADGWLRERIAFLEQVGLDREQIAWYCRKYDEYLDKRLLRQEFPCTAEEAFITSGHGVFDATKLTAQLARASLLTPIVGEFEYRKVQEPIRGKDGRVVDTRPVIADIRFVERADGCIRIQEAPRIRHDEYGEISARAAYAIGGDTAGEGSDFFTAKVVCGLNMHTVATLRRQRMDEDLYAEQLYCLGLHYHEALVAIETNYSRVPTRHLQRLGYPNLYLRERLTGMADEVTLIPGFETNRATRRIIIPDLKAQFREDPACECDVETLKEMSRFIRHPDGKEAAGEGAHDDLVMAKAIANHVAGKIPHTWVEVEREEIDFITKNFGTKNKPRKGLDW